MGLTAVTLLAENTVPILDGLCRYLTAATGVEVAADPARQPASSPEASQRAGDVDLIWACGYLTCELIDSGRLDADIVAAPVFAGEREAVYHSVIVTAHPAIRSLADVAGSRLAINEPISWSGHHALVRHLDPLGTDVSTFGRVVETGSHRASVEAVATGAADVAAIDHTIWAELSSRAQFAEVRVVDRTRDWPSPPFVVHDRVAEAARDALVTALIALPATTVAGLAGVVAAARVDYAGMSPPPLE